MTIAQLRAFLAACDLGSFTAAARELEISQASMSELISRLEEELGLPLFVRGGRRLILTSAADELLPHARGAVSAFQNGFNAVRSISALEGGVCTFGVLRNASYYDLSDLVERFHTRYPNVKVRMVGLNSALVAEAVASGELEAGLVVLPISEPGLHIRPLLRDEVLYVSAARDPASGPATIEELTRNKLVLYDAYAGWRDSTRRQLLERARRHGLSLDPDIEVEHVETALRLVASGTVNTIVARSVLESPSCPQGLTAVPFAEPLHDTLALIRRESTALSPATQKIVEFAEQSLRDRSRRLR